MTSTQNSSFTVDLAVIGAGVIGCATAMMAARQGLSVVVLEQGPRIAEGITSRNSGVIHAGLYYPPQSLKAKLCLRGKDLIYDWVSKNSVAHQKIGKLVVANNALEAEVLEGIFQNALDSGATGLTRLSHTEIQQKEPALPAVAALFSSQTGIIDPYELTRSFRLEAEQHGAVFSFNSPLTRARATSEGYELGCSDFTLHSRSVVNAAGLYSDEIAALVGIDKYKIYPYRGDYFRLKTRQKFHHLIYPVKSSTDAGLGVHLTLDLAGNYKLGPDIEIVESKNDFHDHPEKAALFLQSARKLLGPMPDAEVFYDTCGIRPKLRTPGSKTEVDFAINEDLPGWLNLVGIESPGLTASLAIAEMALQTLGGRLT